MELPKAYDGMQEILELVKGELEDQGYFKLVDIKNTEEYPEGVFHYDVTIGEQHSQNTKVLRFKYEDNEIFIEMCEDCFEKIKSYNTTIKYFWMRLLKWEI